MKKIVMTLSAAAALLASCETKTGTGALAGGLIGAALGAVAWRATIPARPGEPAVAEVHMGPGRHLVSYPLRGGTLRSVTSPPRNRWPDGQNITLGQRPGGAQFGGNIAAVDQHQVHQFLG